MKPSLATTSAQGKSFGLTHGSLCFRKALGEMDRARPLPGMKAGSTPLGRAAICGYSMRRPGGSFGKRISSLTMGASNLTWAMSASPLIVDEKVVVQPGGPGWPLGCGLSQRHRRADLEIAGRQSKPTPPRCLVTLAGRRQLLAVSAERLMGLSVDDGALLWDYPWTTSYDANIPQPLLVDENTVFVSAGYGHGSALVRVSEDNGAFAAAEVWEQQSHEGQVQPAGPLPGACLRIG